MTASSARIRDWSVENRMKAWERHTHELHMRMNRMMRGYGASPEARLLAQASFRAAMVLRRQAMVTPGHDQADAETFTALHATVIALDHPLALPVAQQLERLTRTS